MCLCCEALLREGGKGEGAMIYLLLLYFVYFLSFGPRFAGEALARAFGGIGARLLGCLRRWPVLLR